MSDNTTPEPSPQLAEELKRIAPKIDSAPKAKLKAPKAKPKPEFELSTETPELAEAMALKTFAIKATTKEARGIATMALTPKPYVQYSPQLEQSILSLMAEGFMLVEICARPDMPSASSVQRWCRENPDVDARFTRAREMMGDQFAWEVHRIGLDANPLTFQADRVKMDAYRWLAAKFYPKRYADKTVQELSGTVVHETRHVIDVTALSDDQLAGLEQAMKAAAALPAPKTIEHDAVQQDD